MTKNPFSLLARLGSMLMTAVLLVGVSAVVKVFLKDDSGNSSMSKKIFFIPTIPVAHADIIPSDGGEGDGGDGDGSDGGAGDSGDGGAGDSGDGGGGSSSAGG